jgi:hypothetical protein
MIRSKAVALLNLALKPVTPTVDGEQKQFVIRLLSSGGRRRLLCLMIRARSANLTEAKLLPTRIMKSATSRRSTGSAAMRLGS